MTDTVVILYGDKYYSMRYFSDCSFLESMIQYKSISYWNMAGTLTVL